LILHHVYDAFMPSIKYIWTTFVTTTLSKSIIFKVKNNFEPNVLKLVINIIFIISSPFSLLIINVKILSNFQNEWCTFDRKKGRLKKTKAIHFRSLNALNMQKYFWFVSSFDHAKFAINGKYSKKTYDNPNYYTSLMIFQTYKNAILKNVHSFGWLLWLWFYPRLKIYNLKCGSHVHELIIPKKCEIVYKCLFNHFFDFWV